MKAIFEKTDNFGMHAMRVKNFRGFPPMFHSHLELIYVVSGEIPMIIDGQSHSLASGEMSVLFPYVVHNYESAPEAEAFIILFDPKIAKSFESELLSKKPQAPFLKNAERFEPLFKRIAELIKDGEIGYKTACAYLEAFMGELIALMPLCEVDTVFENMTKPILLYCSKHFCDEDISIKKIADGLYISPSYVSKVFSFKLKYNFREYINELRISKAKELLSKPDARILNIMLECGFQNQSSFNRIFSKICGMSPREYRQKKLVAKKITEP